MKYFILVVLLAGCEGDAPYQLSNPACLFACNTHSTEVTDNETLPSSITNTETNTRTLN